MKVRTHPVLALALLALFAVGGCWFTAGGCWRNATVQSSTSSTDGGFRYQSIVNRDPASRIVVEVAPERNPVVSGKIAVRVASDGDGTRGSSPPGGLSVDGEPVSFADGRLRIGDRDYGELRPPYELSIRAGGVFVDGELREPR